MQQKVIFQLRRGRLLLMVIKFKMNEIVLVENCTFKKKHYDIDERIEVVILAINSNLVIKKLNIFYREVQSCLKKYGKK